jgi:hypothetical protein
LPAGLASFDFVALAGHQVEHGNGRGLLLGGRADFPLKAKPPVTYDGRRFGGGAAQKSRSHLPCLKDTLSHST